MSHSVFEPTPGVAIDRQAIAIVKAEVSVKTVTNVNTLRRDEKGNALETMTPQERIDPKPFVDEANTIQKYLDEGYYLLAPKAIGQTLNGYINEMKSVHAKLFRLNDEIRQLYSEYQKHGETVPSTTKIVTVSFQIVEMQDARHELIRKIDKLFGITSMGRLHEFTGSENKTAPPTTG